MRLPATAGWTVFTWTSFFLRLSSCSSSFLSFVRIWEPVDSYCCRTQRDITAQIIRYVCSNILLLLCICVLLLFKCSKNNLICTIFGCACAPTFVFVQFCTEITALKLAPLHCGSQKSFESNQKIWVLFHSGPYRSSTVNCFPALISYHAVLFRTQMHENKCWSCWMRNWQK